MFLYRSHLMSDSADTDEIDRYDASVVTLINGNSEALMMVKQGIGELPTQIVTYGSVIYD